MTELVKGQVWRLKCNHNKIVELDKWDSIVCTFKDENGKKHFIDYFNRDDHAELATVDNVRAGDWTECFSSEPENMDGIENGDKFVIISANETETLNGDGLKMVNSDMNIVCGVPSMYFTSNFRPCLPPKSEPLITKEATDLSLMGTHSLTDISIMLSTFDLSEGDIIRESETNDKFAEVLTDPSGESLYLHLLTDEYHPSERYVIEKVKEDLKLKCDKPGCDCEFTVHTHESSSRDYYICPECEGMVFFK